MRTKTIFISILLLAAIFLSCKKRVFDAFVVVKTSDISIAGETKPIKYIQFVSSDTGFASPAANYLYRTYNGGQSWEKLFFPNNDTAKKVEFIGHTGFMLAKDHSTTGDALYISNDGGNSWNKKMSCMAFGITESQVIIVLSTTGIYSSVNNGSSFQLKNTSGLSSANEYVVQTIDENVIIYKKSSSEFNYDLVSQNGSTVVTKLSSVNLGNAIISIDDGIWVVGNTWELYYCESIQYGGRQYDLLSNPIQAVSIKNGIALGVGNHVIATNYNKYVSDFRSDTWHDVVDTDGNGFNQNFYSVFQTSAQHFYVGGENGLIWECQL